MEGWKTDKFKNQILYKSGYTWSKEQELKTQEPNSVRVLTVTNIQKDLDLSEELYLQGVSEKDRKEKAVSKDWCIAVSSNGNRKRIGNAVYIQDDTDYLFASFLTAFKPKDDSDILPEYFFRWLSSHTVQERITSVSEGTTGLGNLDIRYLRNMDIHFPEKLEQTAIANILSKVDDAIASVQSSIAVAERLKKSLMQNLLTGRMKPDGTPRNDDEFYMDEKFGKVPVGWEVRQVKEFGEVVTGKTPPTEEHDVFSDKEHGFMFITPGDVGMTKYIKQTERYVSEKGIKYSYRLPQNAVCEICIGSTIGKIGITTKECCTNQQITSVVVNDDNNAEFFYYAMSARREHFRSIAGINATPQINKSEYSKYRILCPKTKTEQSEIAQKLSAIDNEINTYQQRIATFERLKKSLMQNLLTGKVRVKRK